MDVWQQLTEAVRESGVRVDERLRLLKSLRSEEDIERLGDRLDAAVARLEDAAGQLRREARGR